MEPIIEQCVWSVINYLMGAFIPLSAPNYDMEDIRTYYATIIPVIVAWLRNNPTYVWEQDIVDNLTAAMEEAVSPDVPLSAKEHEALLTYWNTLTVDSLSYLANYPYMFDATMPVDPSSSTGALLPDPLPGFPSVFANSIAMLYFPTSFPASQGDINTLTAYYTAPVISFVQFARANQGLLHP